MRVELYALLPPRHVQTNYHIGKVQIYVLRKIYTQIAYAVSDIGKAIYRDKARVGTLRCTDFVPSCIASTFETNEPKITPNSASRFQFINYTFRRNVIARIISILNS